MQSPALPTGIPLHRRYRILRTLGCGGFGITYLATAPGNSRVVIKEHFPSWCAQRAQDGITVVVGNDSEAPYHWSLKTFKQEAQMLSVLHNPNIVSVIEPFEENGTAYYVMPYIRDGSLADGAAWLRKHGARLSQAAVLKLMRILLAALDHMHHSSLHGQPIYHLDIKPANILLSRLGTEEVPVLIDFGSPGMGSVGYVPHEQRRGELIGPWCDLYGLGASMHALLTGKTPPPHLDKNHEPLTTPPLRDLLSEQEVLLRHYDPRLLQSIDKALNWEPRERYTSAAAWAADLDEIPLRWNDSGLTLIELIQNVEEERTAGLTMLDRSPISSIGVFVSSMLLALLAGAGILWLMETQDTSSELPDEKAEPEQAAREQAAREQAAREQAEREQAEREQAEREQAEREQAEREQAEREQAEREQAAREQAAREQAEREQAEREQAAREQAEREQAEREQAEREQAAREQAEREQAAREQAEREQAAREQAARERAARERAELEQAEREQAAREKAQRERAERERAERERAARERAEREQAARERAERERAAREQAAREKAAREQAAREQAARERAARERAEREQAAREKAQRENNTSAASTGHRCPSKREAQGARLGSSSGTVKRILEGVRQGCPTCTFYRNELMKRDH